MGIFNLKKKNQKITLNMRKSTENNEDNFNIIKNEERLEEKSKQIKKFKIFLVKSNKKQDKKSKKDKQKIKDKKLDKNKSKKEIKIREKKKKEFNQSEIEVINIHCEEDNFIKKTQEEDIQNLDIQEGDIVYKKQGFGYKGLGSRKIIFDEKLKEYFYKVEEPKLTPEEEEIKNLLIYFFRVRADLDVFDIDEKQKIKNLENALDKIISEKNIKLDDKSKDNIYYYVFQEFLGFGKIDILMHDPGIEDISCDGIRVPIFIYHKDFDSIRSNIYFENVDELDSFVIKLSQMCGKQISVYEPIVDGKLEDGSRLQTTLSRTITRYSTFTIRRFKEDPLTPIDLIENNTMSIEMAAYFWMAIERGTNILFCGGTAAGKTTALNALSLFLPSTFKIVSIEDTREINLPHENWIAGTTRTGFSSSEAIKSGKDIDMFDLIKVALRQRPKVIIVGEVRGKEAYTLFQAMTTGHLSYSTVHASDMHTLVQRLENKPIDLPRALLTSLDLIVFLNSVVIDGLPVRRITNITEVIKLDPGTNRLVTIAPFHWVSEIKDKFETNGGSKILEKIKMQYGWDDTRLQQELEIRKKILKWMIKNNLRSYEDVGRIVSEFKKDPKAVLKRIDEAS